MQSTPNLRDTDPHDVFVIEPDASLAARADKAPLDLLYDVLSGPAAPRPSDSTPAHVRPDAELRIAPDFSASPAAPALETAVRADAVEDDIRLGETEISAHQPRTSKFARGAVMSLFALVSATGAAAWQHYGDDAKAMMANWTPPFALASLASTAKPATTEAAPAVQAASADQVTAPAQPAASAPATAATAAPEATQQLQAMARDLAAMGQQISDLKATIEQLKASQAQMTQAPISQSQVVSPPARTTEARLTEPTAPITRPKIVPPPPQPAHSTVSTLARRPKQVFPYAPIAPAPPPPQTAAAPVQIAPQAEDGGPVVRPPMPLH
ncbi:hypothetical protein [Afipia sp. GAS231]|uniref:hypothetical protein n=1 Tax=Afipia sp. GAS231 TaxID=1882747 RepID=UPI000879EFA0|nr:hypothetical protein [Afipia sp. GAS231]SDP42811.1 hypothetical protein SAMN05444050_6825 [Afipia sp. GAS231]